MTDHHPTEDQMSLTNDELQQAIDKAIENIKRFGTVQASYHSLEHHLHDLLSIQRRRAEGVR